MEIVANDSTFWRKCTSCKRPICFAKKYWICSVSTCNRVRTDLVFCSLNCFDAHVPVMNHRDAGALEKKSPLEHAPERSQEESPPRHNAHVTQGQSSVRVEPKPVQLNPSSKKEILVVASKIKEYIRLQSGLNTSDSIMSVLSDKIRFYLDDAIRVAIQNERKTVLDRDIK